MGLTVACARCHDHKYDPIPTADYYSLYGVFASSTEPDPAKLAGATEDSPGYRTNLEELTKRQQVVADYRLQVRRELTALLREHAGDFLLAILKQRQTPGAAEAAYEHGEPREKLIALWQRWLEQPGRERHPVFRLSFELVQHPRSSSPRGSQNCSINSRIPRETTASMYAS